MKHLKTVFNALKGGCMALCLWGGWAPATAQDSLAMALTDSVEVSLLTCQPHDEIYSLYGHTAIRFHDMREASKLDVAFNYGVFSFDRPFFVPRFVFGLTDYELGVYPYQIFQREYRHFGSMVTEQVLNLTPAEKEELRNALGANLQPENAIYRYNFFYNNCTTKARDIIEQCISGDLQYTEREGHNPTYRDMVHEMTKHHPWARFGNDLLLGIMADQPTTLREQEFLPGNLMYDFDHAQIYDRGAFRPLVSQKRISVPAGVQLLKPGSPLSPWGCAIILLAAGIIIFAWEWRRRRTLLLWDILLMTVTGTFGIVLTLMLFSQHPTVRVNLQFILLNPLPWVFLWKVAKRKKSRYWDITAILAALFLIGSLFQQYAEGIILLAPCLLLQCYANKKLTVYSDKK